MLLNSIKLISCSILLITISFFLSSKSYAQAEIFGFGGYMVSSDVMITQGDLNTFSNPNYGAGIAFEVEKGIKAELFWVGQQTYMQIEQLNGGVRPLFDVGIHYFQGGAVYEFRQSRRQKAFPFTSFSLGATLFDPHDTSVSEEWRFSVTFGIGGKFYLTETVGLRLQARLLLPLNFSGGGMWCGTGGCSVGVGAWATFVQADFTGGVFIQLGK